MSGCSRLSQIGDQDPGRGGARRTRAGRRRRRARRCSRPRRTRSPLRPGRAAPTRPSVEPKLSISGTPKPSRDRRAQLGCAGLAGAGDRDRARSAAGRPAARRPAGRARRVAVQHGCAAAALSRSTISGKRQRHRCRMEPERQPAPGRQQTGEAGGVHGRSGGDHRDGQPARRWSPMAAIARRRARGSASRRTASAAGRSSTNTPRCPELPPEARAR